jgi:hypothetical protein
MKRAVMGIAALALASCATAPTPTCQSKEKAFERIATAIDGGQTQVVWRAGETLGWKLTGVKETAPIRRAGFKDTDLLAKVCGLSIDQFVEAEDRVCCSANTKGVTLTFTRPDGSSYEVSA